MIYSGLIILKVYITYRIIILAGFLQQYKNLKKYSAIAYCFKIIELGTIYQLLFFHLHSVQKMDTRSRSSIQEKMWIISLFHGIQLIIENDEYFFVLMNL